MQIDRVELIDKLETVEPALAVHNLVPQMTHFWFTGKDLMAYNDQIAISVPLETDFEGAVPGDVLLKLLKSAITKKPIEMVSDGTTVQIKAGKANMRLGLLPPDVFIHTQPEMGEPTVSGNELAELLRVINGLARSIGTDTSIPEQLGITVVPNGKALDLYTTNSSTISAAVIKKRGKLERRVILSTLFCKQMLALNKKGKNAELEIAQDHAFFKIGDITLFGKLIECDRPFDFKQTIEFHFPAKAHNKLIDMPKGLRGALERATIITEAKVDQALTKITVVGDSAKLFSRSDRGEVADRVRLDGEHDEVSITVNPKLLLTGLDDFQKGKMIITSDCVVMADDNGTQYLVSASNTAS